jgi:hypothetical protein
MSESTDCAGVGQCPCGRSEQGETGRTEVAFERGFQGVSRKNSRKSRANSNLVKTATTMMMAATM